MTQIPYPYLPEGRAFKYVSADHPIINLARAYAQVNSQDLKQKVACAIVRDGRVIGLGANGSSYHQEHGCRRKELGCATGVGYELCEGCHPKNHAEVTALTNVLRVCGLRVDESLTSIAAQLGAMLTGCDVYMWGHCWACQPCWDAMIALGIRDVYLLEGSECMWGPVPFTARVKMEGVLGG